MDENKKNDQYKAIYQTMNQILKYYKKYSFRPFINWDAAVAEGTEIYKNSTVPEFAKELILSIQDQLYREESMHGETKQRV